MDIEDYVAWGAIGSGNIKIDLNTSVWSDMYTTARATRDAFIKAATELILGITNKSIKWSENSTITIWENALDEYTESYKIMEEKMAIFWNSVIPVEDKLTGIQTKMAPKYTPFEPYDFDVDGIAIFQLARTSSIGEVSFSYDLTGTESFQEIYWEEYRDSVKNYLASLKRFIALSTDFRPGENDYPGEIPPFGFRSPEYPV